MPFSPSDFEWWAWLLFGVGAGVGCIICVFATSACAEDDKLAGALGCGFIAFVFGVAGVGCFFIGVIRFVKWVWGS